MEFVSFILVYQNLDMQQITCRHIRFIALLQWYVHIVYMLLINRCTSRKEFLIYRGPYYFPVSFVISSLFPGKYSRKQGKLFTDIVIMVSWCIDVPKRFYTEKKFPESDMIAMVYINSSLWIKHYQFVLI